MMVKQGHSNELSETTFRALIENAHDGIVLYDYNGNIKFASASIKRFGGYRESELIGRSGLEFIHPDDLENAQKLFIELLDKPGKSVTVFQRLRAQEGPLLLVRSTADQFSSRPGDQWYCFKLSRHH